LFALSRRPTSFRFTYGGRRAAAAAASVVAVMRGFMAAAAVSMVVVAAVVVAVALVACIPHRQPMTPWAPRQAAAACKSGRGTGGGMRALHCSPRCRVPSSDRSGVQGRVGTGGALVPLHLDIMQMTRWAN